MKVSTRIAPRPLPRTFNELNALYPLRPVADEIDLRNAEQVMDRLAVLKRRTKDQEDYLETLILLVESYEADESADALDRSKTTGADALKYLMEARGMKQTELARLLKVGPSAVSMILSGDRPITADHARRLARHFALSPAAFL